MGTPVKPRKLSLPGNGVSELLTAPELAALFKLNSQTLYRLARRGMIPAIRIGEKSLRFDPIQVREALLEGRRASRTRVRPRRSSARPTAFTRLEDLRVQNRWIAPSPGIALERFAVDFPPGIDLTTLAYKETSR
jgi:excisionase family DNA binding protein